MRDDIRLTFFHGSGSLRSFFPKSFDQSVVACRLNGSNSVGSVNLPVKPPVLPMLAKRIDELPAGQTWIFEPKWDGFRALIFRDGDEILIQSRDAKSLNRYFPGVDRAARRAVARSMCSRRRNRRRKERRARLRGIAAADSSGCLAGETAVAAESRRRSSFSICCAKAIAIGGANRSSGGAKSWSRCWLARRRQSI